MLKSRRKRERDSEKQQSIKKAVTSTKINKISFLKFRSIPEIIKKNLSHYTFIVIHPFRGYIYSSKHILILSDQVNEEKNIFT